MSKKRKKPKDDRGTMMARVRAARAVIDTYQGDARAMPN